MEPMGVCTKPSSPWAAPLHMTPKTDSTWRLCGNYRRLNNVTEADKYPMPNIQDITNSLGKAAVFIEVRSVKRVFSGACDTIGCAEDRNHYEVRLIYVSLFDLRSGATF